MFIFFFNTIAIDVVANLINTPYAFFFQIFFEVRYDLLYLLIIFLLCFDLFEN
jgi:hypothetical protein